MSFTDKDNNFTEDGLFAITFDGMEEKELDLRENCMIVIKHAGREMINPLFIHLN